MSTKHTPEAPAFTVGDRVVALVNMENDLTCDGMGVELCASKGEELIVRRVSFGYLNCIAVSHEHVTDRAFCVAPDEIAKATGS
jgi:hypothetical protein